MTSGSGTDHEAPAGHAAARAGAPFDLDPPTVQIHVADLLAAHGRAIAPSGRRRRAAPEAEVEVVAPEAAPSPVTEVAAPEAAPSPVTEVVPTPTSPSPTPAPSPAPAPANPVPAPAPAPAESTPVPTPPAPAPPALAEPVHEVDHEPREPVPAHRGPVREWATVLVQLLGALAAGAALWFGFRVLWQSVPVLAAILATVVTLGLVVLVRVVRRDTDLVTAALALLAGLVVTFSPPLLALTGG